MLSFTTGSLSSAGSLSLANTSSLTLTTGGLTNTGSINLSDTATASIATAMNNTGGTVTAANTSSITVFGTLTTGGAGNSFGRVVLSGATASLSGAYTGTGELRLDSAATITLAAATSSKDLTLAGTGTTITQMTGGSLTLSDALTLGANTSFSAFGLQPVSIAGNISTDPASTITVDGTNPLILTGNKTQVLSLGRDLGAITVNKSGGQVNATLTQPIAGALTLASTNSGAVFFLNAASITGATRLLTGQSGALMFNNTAGLTSLSLEGTQTGNVAFMGAATLSGALQLQGTQTGSVTFGATSSTGAVSLASGSIVLSAPLTTTSITTTGGSFNAGTNLITANGNVDFADATLSAGANLTTNNASTVDLRSNSLGNLSLNATGALSLRVTGAVTALSLNNSAATTLQATSPLSLGSLTLTNAGALNLNSNSLTATGNLNFNGVSLNNPGTLTINGTMTRSLVTPSAATRFAAVVINGGTTTVSGGNLLLANLNLAAGATLRVPVAGNLTSASDVTLSGVFQQADTTNANLVLDGTTTTNLDAGNNTLASLNQSGTGTVSLQRNLTTSGSFTQGATAGQFDFTNKTLSVGGTTSTINLTNIANPGLVTTTATSASLATASGVSLSGGLRVATGTTTLSDDLSLSTLTVDSSLAAVTFDVTATGNVSFGSGSTFTKSGAQTFHLGGGTLTTSGNALNNLNITGTVSAADNLVLDGTLNLAAGASNFTAQAAFTVAGATTVSNGMASFNGAANFNGTAAFSGGTSTLRAASTFAQALNLSSNGTLRVRGATTFSAGITAANTSTFDAQDGPYTLTFQNGSTFAINDTASLNLMGNGGFISLRSNTPASQWRINLVSGTAPVLNRIDVQDSDGTGSNANVLTAVNSIDSGNNLNWFFGQRSITARIGDGNDDIRLHRNGVEIASKSSDATGLVTFPNVDIPSGARVLVFVNVPGGSATMTVSTGLDIVLPDNTALTGSLIVTHEAAGGILSNADLVTAFMDVPRAGVPADRRPFTAMGNNLTFGGVTTGYTIAVTGSPIAAGNVTWRPGANLIFNGVDSRLVLAQRATVDAMMMPTGNSNGLMTLESGVSLSSAGTNANSTVATGSTLSLLQGSSATLAGPIALTGSLSLADNVPFTATDIALNSGANLSLAAGSSIMDRDLSIASGATVSLAASSTINGRAFSNAGTLSANSASLVRATGLVTTGGIGATRRFGNLTLFGATSAISGALDVQNTLTIDTQTITLAEAITSQNLSLLNSNVTQTALLDLGGNLTVNATSALTFGAALLSVSGDISINSAASLTANPANPLTLDGSNGQLIDLGGKMVAGLTLAKPAGTATFTTPLTTASDLLVSQGLLAFTANLDIGGAIRILSGVGQNGRLDFFANSVFIRGASLILNNGTSFIGTGPVTLGTGTTNSTDFGGSATTSGTVETGALTINLNVGQTLTARSNLALSGPLNVAQGTLDAQSRNISLAISSNPGVTPVFQGSFVANTGQTVTISGNTPAGTETLNVSGVGFQNLTLTGENPYAFTSTMARVQGDLNISINGKAGPGNSVTTNSGAMSSFEAGNLTLTRGGATGSIRFVLSALTNTLNGNGTINSSTTLEGLGQDLTYNFLGTAVTVRSGGIWRVTDTDDTNGTSSTVNFGTGSLLSSLPGGRVELNVNGNANPSMGDKITLQTQGGVGSWTFTNQNPDATGNTVIGARARVQGSNASGGEFISAINSIDLGNNQNWLFNATTQPVQFFVSLFGADGSPVTLTGTERLRVYGPDGARLLDTPATGAATINVGSVPVVQNGLYLVALRSSATNVGFHGMTLVKFGVDNGNGSASITLSLRANVTSVVHADTAPAFTGTGGTVSTTDVLALFSSAAAGSVLTTVNDAANRAQNGIQLRRDTSVLPNDTLRIAPVGEPGAGGSTSYLDGRYNLRIGNLVSFQLSAGNLLVLDHGSIVLENGATFDFSAGTQAFVRRTLTNNPATDAGDPNGFTRLPGSIENFSTMTGRGLLFKAASTLELDADLRNRGAIDATVDTAHINLRAAGDAVIARSATASGNAPTIQINKASATDTVQIVDQALSILSLELRQGRLDLNGRNVTSFGRVSIDLGMGSTGTTLLASAASTLTVGGDWAHLTGNLNNANLALVFNGGGTRSFRAPAMNGALRDLSVLNATTLRLDTAAAVQGALALGGATAGSLDLNSQTFAMSGSTLSVATNGTIANTNGAGAHSLTGTAFNLAGTATFGALSTGTGTQTFTGAGLLNVNSLSLGDNLSLASLRLVLRGNVATPLSTGAFAISRMTETIVYDTATAGAVNVTPFAYNALELRSSQGAQTYTLPGAGASANSLLLASNTTFNEAARGFGSTGDRPSMNLQGIFNFSGPVNASSITLTGQLTGSAGALSLSSDLNAQGGLVNLSGAPITFTNAGAKNLRLAAATNFNAFNVDTGASVNVIGGALNISQGLTVNGALSLADAGVTGITVAGPASLAAALTQGPNAIARFNGGLSLTGTGSYISAPGQSTEVASSFSLASGAVFTKAAGATLRLRDLASLADSGTNDLGEVRMIQGMSGNLALTGSLTATNLTIESGANLSNTGTLNLLNDLTITGTLAGNGAANVTRNLTVDLGASFSSGTGAIDVNNRFANNGTFNAGSGSLFVAGDLANGGTFNATQGTIVLDGAASSTLAGVQLFNLTVNKATPALAVTAGNGLTVTSNTLLQEGQLVLNTSSLMRGNVTVEMGAALTSTASGTYSFGDMASSNPTVRIQNGGRFDFSVAVGLTSLLFENGAPAAKTTLITETGSTFNLTGNAGSPLRLQGRVATITPADYWFVTNNGGTYAFTNVAITNSNAEAFAGTAAGAPGTPIDVSMAPSMANSKSNSPGWKVKAGTPITISGTTTPNTSVRLLLADSLGNPLEDLGLRTSDGAGLYSFTNITTNSGDRFALYNDTGTRGMTVMKIDEVRDISLANISAEALTLMSVNSPMGSPTARTIANTDLVALIPSGLKRTGFLFSNPLGLLTLDANVSLAVRDHPTMTNPTATIYNLGTGQLQLPSGTGSISVLGAQTTATITLLAGATITAPGAMTVGSNGLANLGGQLITLGQSFNSSAGQAVFTGNQELRVSGSILTHPAAAAGVAPGTSVTATNTFTFDAAMASATLACAQPFGSLRLINSADVDATTSLDLRGSLDLSGGQLDIGPTGAPLNLSVSGASTVGDGTAGRGLSLSGDATLGGALTVAMGAVLDVTLNGNNANITLNSGDWQVRGVFIAGTGRVTFNSPVAQLIEQLSAFHDLTISNTAVRTTASNLALTGALTVNTGATLRTDGYNLNLAASTSSPAVTVAGTLQLQVDGAITRATTLTLPAATSSVSGLLSVTGDATRRVRITGSGGANIVFPASGQLTANQLNVDGLGSNAPAGGLVFNGTTVAPALANTTFRPVANGAALEFINETLTASYPTTVTFSNTGLGGSNMAGINVLRQVTATSEAGNYLIFNGTNGAGNELYGEAFDSDFTDALLPPTFPSRVTTQRFGSVLFPVNGFQLTQAEFFDEINRDGRVDRVTLFFNDAIDDTTLQNFGSNDIMVSVGGTTLTARLSITDNNRFDNSLNLELNPSTVLPALTGDTGAATSVEIFSTSGLRRAGTSTIISPAPGAVVAADRAPPFLLLAETLDDNSSNGGLAFNGSLDTIRLTFSEIVNSDTTNASLSLVSAGAMTASNLSIVTPSGTSPTILVQLPEAIFANNTGPTGTFAYVQPGTGGGIKDATGFGMPNETRNITNFVTTDRAQPVILSAVLNRAAPTPGFGDNIDVTFSEPVNQLFNNALAPQNTFHFERSSVMPPDITNNVYLTAREITFSNTTRTLCRILIGTDNPVPGGTIQLNVGVDELVLQTRNASTPGDTGMLADDNGNFIESSNRVTLAPPGPPRVLQASTFDNNRDGIVDHIVLVLDQPVVDTTYSPFSAGATISATRFDFDAVRPTTSMPTAAAGALGANPLRIFGPGGNSLDVLDDSVLYLSVTPKAGMSAASDATDTITITGSYIRTDQGTPNQTQSNIVVFDNCAPVLWSVDIVDGFSTTAPNGQVDRVVLSFSEPVIDNTFDFTAATPTFGGRYDFTANRIPTGFMADANNDAILVLGINETGAFNTSLDPAAHFAMGATQDAITGRVTNGLIRDAAGNAAAPAAATGLRNFDLAQDPFTTVPGVRERDFARPFLTDARTLDDTNGMGNGLIDRQVLRFSEVMRSTTANPDFARFSIVNHSVVTAQSNINGVEITVGINELAIPAGDTETTPALTLSNPQVADLNLRGQGLDVPTTFAFNGGALPISATDIGTLPAGRTPAQTPADLPLEITGFTPRDTAQPVVLSVGTADKNTDGRIDTLRVTYSEPVFENTYRQVAGFVGTNPQLSNTSLAFFTGSGATELDNAFPGNLLNDRTIYIRIDESLVDARIGNSDVVGLFATSNQGLVADLVSTAPNPARQTSAITIFDETAPVLLRVDFFESPSLTPNGQIDRLRLTYSEVVNDSSYRANTATDLATPLVLAGTTENPNATDRTVTVLVTETLPAGQGNTGLDFEYTAATDLIRDLVGNASRQVLTGDGNVAAGQPFEIDQAAPVLLEARYPRPLQRHTGRQSAPPDP
jgi:fibronectin-binding autotransporter adhesin